MDQSKPRVCAQQHLCLGQGSLAPQSAGIVAAANCESMNPRVYVFAKDVRAKAIIKALVVLLCRLMFLKLIIYSLRLPAFIRGFVTQKELASLTCGYEMKGFTEAKYAP